MYEAIGKFPTYLFCLKCWKGLYQNNWSTISTSTSCSQTDSRIRAFHSTETVLADILSDILLAIDSGNFSQLSLLDLSAAFDTIDHDILLQRLYLSFGLSSTVLEWMTSYLTDRQQCVRHAGSSSTTTILTCGVPQGS